LVNAILLSFVAAVVVAVALAAWVAHLVRNRHEDLRARGYELIACLKAYGAWIDCHRDDLPVPHDLDELALPEPLARACAVKDGAFPSLSQHMLQLLQAHSRLVECLWRRNLLRLTQGAGRPAWRDPQYLHVRGAIEDLLEEIIGLTQEKIGDRTRSWRGTGTDFSFSGGVSGTTTPRPHT
jgi:hypothetical protein